MQWRVEEVAAGHRAGYRHRPSLAVLAVLLCAVLTAACASTSAIERPTSPSLGAAQVVEYRVPTPAAGPDLIVAASNGDLWFTEVSASPEHVGRLSPNGVVTEYSLHTTDVVPFGLAWGPDGNLWVLESGATAAHPAGSLARLSPTGQVTRFALPSVGIGRPYANNLAVGPDGALWFTEGARGRIARMTLAGSYSDFVLPVTDAVPGSITAGSDGNLWFTEVQGHNVGRITPAGYISEFPVEEDHSNPNPNPNPDSSPGQFLSAIVSGNDGGLWFTDASGTTSPTGRPHDYIGRISSGGTIHLFPLPTFNVSPRGIATGPDGSLWFTESSPQIGHVGRMTPGGTLTEFDLPTPDAVPADIAVTSSGVWFTESARDVIGHLIPATAGL